MLAHGLQKVSAYGKISKVERNCAWAVYKRRSSCSEG